MKICILVDEAKPADRNVTQKEAEKKFKYKSLCVQLQRMWNLKSKIIPVIIGATRVVTKSLKKNVETLPYHTFNRFTTKDSYTRNITHNTESAAV